MTKQMLRKKNPRLIVPVIGFDLLLYFVIAWERHMELKLKLGFEQSRLANWEWVSSDC